MLRREIFHQGRLGYRGYRALQFVLFLFVYTGDLYSQLMGLLLLNFGGYFGLMEFLLYCYFGVWETL